MFKPTYLYIKRHKVTGKCYFGKTTTADPEKYNGSGKAWCEHLKENGCLIETLWYKLFTIKDECKQFALDFSRRENIVESDLWLNLIPENGLSGSGRKVGFKMSAESLAKLSQSKMGKTLSDEHKAKLSDHWKGRIISDEHKAAISAAHKGKIMSEESKSKMSLAHQNRDDQWRERQRLAHSAIVICPHCAKDGGSSAMKRWHFDNCKKAK